MNLRNLFVPVLFANGQDDDLPGMLAAVQHHRVQFDDHVYEPHESIFVKDRTLRFSRPIHAVGRHSPPFIPAPGAVVVVEGDAGRHIELNHCTLVFEHS